NIDDAMILRATKSAISLRMDQMFNAKIEKMLKDDASPGRIKFIAEKVNTYGIKQDVEYVILQLAKGPDLSVMDPTERTALIGKLLNDRLKMNALKDTPITIPIPDLAAADYEPGTREWAKAWSAIDTLPGKKEITIELDKVKEMRQEIV